MLTRETAKELRDRYGLQYFVETGIGVGDCRSVHVADLFEQAWAIDIGEENCRLAAQKGVPNLTVLRGDSSVMLAELLPTLGVERVFYWLDAHWVGGGDAPEVECPLLAELAVIGKYYVRDVVLIDDARLFIGRPPPPHDPAKWPTLDEIREAVRGWPATLRIDEAADVIAIEPKARS